jgi:hypothetical protein
VTSKGRPARLRSVDLHAELICAEKETRKMAVLLAASPDEDDAAFYAAADEGFAQRALLAAMRAAGLTGDLDEEGVENALQVSRALRAATLFLGVPESVTAVFTRWVENLESERLGVSGSDTQVLKESPH